MSALRDRVNLHCWGCNADLNNLDPIPPVARYFISCPNGCENGGIEVSPGEYEECEDCEGHGEIVLCHNCYIKYLHSD